MVRRRRPLARLPVAAATAGIAYHARYRRAQRPSTTRKGPRRTRPARAYPTHRSTSRLPRPRRGARSTSSAGSCRCTTPAPWPTTSSRPPRRSCSAR